MHSSVRTISIGFAVLAVALGASAAPEHVATTPEITKADIASRDKAIADDVFEGRGPGTKAGEASAQWIADELQRIGVKPGNHGSYFQKVPTVVITLDAAKSSLSLNTKEGAMSPKFPDEVVYWSPRYDNAVQKIENAPLVFVGYGVVAPEYGWDDYAGIDVKGKTVVILVNDPGNEDASPDQAFFKGKAMTYYGRWTYKYEEAARHGAAAAIIVHETKPAAYGWQVVRNSNSGATSWLLTDNKGASDVTIRSWITLDTAKALFARSGMDYLAMKAAANKPGFKPVVMDGASLSLTATSTFEFLDTRNVVGIIPGSTRPNDVLIYSAHWDHLGIKPDLEGPDKIYNGAVDNAMGVSMVLDIAEKFVHEKQPQRSVAFLLTTLEEQGLLGAAYFASHPIWPLNHIVGDLNLDANLPSGTMLDMVLPGNGQSELEDFLISALKTQGRTLSPDPTPEHGGFFRADHFALAKLGVPAITPGSGSELKAGGKPAAEAIAMEYLKNHYHQPADEYDPSWDMTGPVDDAQALYIAGEALANSSVWPNWREGSEFKPARDAIMKGKK